MLFIYMIMFMISIAYVFFRLYNIIIFLLIVIIYFVYSCMCVSYTYFPPYFTSSTSSSPSTTSPFLLLVLFSSTSTFRQCFPLPPTLSVPLKFPPWPLPLPYHLIPPFPFLPPCLCISVCVLYECKCVGLKVCMCVYRSVWCVCDYRSVCVFV